MNNYIEVCKSITKICPGELFLAFCIVFIVLDDWPPTVNNKQITSILCLWFQMTSYCKSVNELTNNFCYYSYNFRWSTTYCKWTSKSAKHFTKVEWLEIVPCCRTTWRLSESNIFLSSFHTDNPFLFTVPALITLFVFEMLFPCFV